MKRSCCRVSVVAFLGIMSCLSLLEWNLVQRLRIAENKQFTNTGASVIDYSRQDISDIKSKDDMSGPKEAEILTSDVTESQREQNNASWMQFQKHIYLSRLYHNNDKIVDTLLYDMATLPIVATEEIPTGTQLKLIVTFQDEGKAVLKFNSLRHLNEHQTYSDQHYGEITAFHVDRLLEFYRVPPVVGRIVNIVTDIEPLVSSEFRSTISNLTDGRVCLYGRCQFCFAKDPVCGTPQNIEVSMMHYVPFPRTKVVNLWYKYLGNSVPKLNQLCDETRADIAKGGTHYLEHLDILYFDMIIGNYDRHTHEYLQQFHGQNGSKPILLDHGKSFASDKSNVMVELFMQKERRCCLMKESTFHKFFKLSQGPPLSKLVNDSLKSDPLFPVLSEKHLLEMDARLNKIVNVVLECMHDNTVNDVIIKD